MINKKRLGEILADYKKDFSDGWSDDLKSKLQAVKIFQDNWNINAENFADMLERSLEGAKKDLLSAANYFPKIMIVGLARSASEEVRNMFIALYDENKNVYERIENFKNKSAELLEKYGNGAAQHHQDEHAISVYLWLRFPDKYYIYRYSEAKAAAQELGTDYIIKKGFYSDNIKNAFGLYDEMRAEIMNNSELINLVHERIDESCYPDPEFRTLTQCIGFYISQSTEDSPERNLAEEDWLAMLGNKEIFTDSSLQIMKRMKKYGGEASCTELSRRFGETVNFYNSGSTGLARRVAKAVGITLSEDFWTILYTGRTEGGLFVWRLRDELSAALDKINLDDVPLYAEKIPEGIFYSKEKFLEDVFMSEEKYNALEGVLRYKKNIILQGAPGVGKTFAAVRLAWAMMGEKDNDRIEFVQFHQSYSYDDFVMGYKPAGEGFELREGVFYRFCKKAESRPEKDYFFIIDEINRGNLSKIFGELLMLIEKDYRGTEITSAYGNEKFSVPENLYIIGMMNTADRSLAMIDYALRRRFSFFEMEPGFNSDGFLRYQKNLENETLDELIEKIKELNTDIERDPSLGKGFKIGHSYFCGQTVCTEDWLRSVVNYDIIPTLEEYWFDEPEKKLDEWVKKLNGVFK